MIKKLIKPFMGIILVMSLFTTYMATPVNASDLQVQPRFETCDGDNLHMSNWYTGKTTTRDNTYVYVWETRICSYCGYEILWKIIAVMAL